MNLTPYFLNEKPLSTVSHQLSAGSSVNVWVCFYENKVTGFLLLSKSSLLHLYGEKKKKDCTRVPICCHGFPFSDKMFPALGFGAQLPPDWKVRMLIVMWFVCSRAPRWHVRPKERRKTFGLLSANLHLMKAFIVHVAHAFWQFTLLAWWVHIKMITQLSMHLCCRSTEVMKRTKKQFTEGGWEVEGVRGLDSIS